MPEKPRKPHWKWAPQQRKQAILDAARTLFVTKGFDRTSVKEVTELAGVASSHLYHFFDSKEALFREVSNHLVEPYVRLMTTVLAEEAEQLDVLTLLASSYFNFLKDNPDIVQLLGWWSIKRPSLGDTLPPTEDVMKCMAAYRATIARAQVSGQIRTNASPEEILFSIQGLCEHWFLNACDLLQCAPDAVSEAHHHQRLKNILDAVTRAFSP